MALLKIRDYYPNYKDEIFGGDDIKGMDVYSSVNNDKIGTVHDALVGDDGRFRYLVVDTGFWVFGKKILLPVGQCRIDYQQKRVYATQLSKEQAENLPEYRDDMTVDYDYEENVRNIYRAPAVGGTAMGTAATATQANTAATGYTANQASYTGYDRDTYDYNREPHLYDMNEQNHQNLKLYEERLVANKQRRQAGNVVIGKHVETEVARTSVPVEKERVVIERSNPTGGRAVAPGEADFREGEVARMEVYEETADIHKEAVVREEVNIRKEVDRDTVNAEETLRREELDVDVDGNPVVRRDR
jgi:uncharacterized protein (TIGR02271 family)